MCNLKLSPPWIEYAEQVKALFGRDPEVEIEYDDKRKTLTLRVESQRKASALLRLIPARVDFGGVEACASFPPTRRARRFPTMRRLWTCLPPHSSATPP